MKKMIRLSVSGNHSQLTILLYLVSFDLSSILSKFWPNCLEKVKCPDGHLRFCPFRMRFFKISLDESAAVCYSPSATNFCELL